jgi:hypothetical protein
MSAGPYVRLSDTGTVSYGGYTWDPLYKSKLTAKARWDEAEKTITCWEFTLHVSGRITSGAPASTGTSTAAAMNTLAAALMEPGGPLKYQSKGWDFAVNTGGASQVYDSMWGPKPRTVSFVPIGNALAADVEWECTFALPVCPNATTYQGLPMAFNSEHEWSYDGTGALELTVSGYLEIPLTRQTQGQVIPPDWADKYREKIYTDPPVGLIPKTRKFHQSKDQRRLNFTLVFVQPYAPLPNGCVRAEARHSLDSSWMKSRWRNWNGMIDASFTVPPGTPKAVTLGYFGLLAARLLKTFSVLAAQNLKVAKGDQATVLVDDFSVEEDVFLGTCHYRMGYHIFGAPPDVVLGASGLWQPVPGTDFAQWKSSMALPWGSRGVNGATFDPNLAVIVDLCQGQTRAFRSKGLPTTTNLKPGLLPGTNVTVLNPKATWIAFENRLEVLTDEKTTLHKPLVSRTLKATVPNRGIYGSGPDVNGGGVSGLGTGTGYPSPPLGAGKLINNQDSGFPPKPSGATLNNNLAGQTGPLGTLQAVGSPIYRLRMRGYGVRVGFEVPDPELTTIGGVTAVPEKRWVGKGTLGSAGPYDIFYTQWDKIYLVTAIPTELPSLPNPIDGF